MRLNIQYYTKNSEETDSISVAVKHQFEKLIEHFPLHTLTHEEANNFMRKAVELAQDKVGMVVNEEFLYHLHEDCGVYTHVFVSQSVASMVRNPSLTCDDPMLKSILEK